jgi:DNA-binding LytR/AlgR family response regulator
MNTNIKIINEISLKTVEGYSFFKYQEIVRFEAYHRYTWIYVIKKDKPQIVYHKFSEVEEKIDDESFFKCQRSHIVNIHHVKHFNTKDSLLITENGEVPISEGHVKEFKDRYCR